MARGDFEPTPIGHSDPAKGDQKAIQILLQRGFSPEAILRLAQDGKLANQAQQKANMPGGQYFNPYDFGARSGGLEQTRTQVGGKALDALLPFVAGAAGNGVLDALSGKRASIGASGGTRPADTAPKNVGASRQGKAATISRAVDAVNKYKKIYTAFKQGKAAQDAGAIDDPSLTGPTPPDISQFQPTSYTPPVLERRDFTDQANQLAAQAYGPMYAALQAGKTNATGQYNTSDTVVKGLYDRLAAETQASADKSKASYAQAGTDAGARYAALQDQIAQNYNAAQGQENDLLQQNGLQAAASTVLPDDRGFQQAEVAKSGAAQQDYYAKQGQAEQDYMAKLGLANQTEGNVQRQNLVQQLSQVLNQYDQQNLQLQGQQSQSAMDIANRLSDQDFQLQQANAGLQADAFSANANAQGNAAQLAQQAYSNQYQQYRDQIGDQQFNRQQDLQDNKYRTDLAMAAADMQAKQGGTGLEFNQLPPQQQVVAQGDQLTGGQGQQYFDFLNQFIGGQDPNQYNLQTFSTEVAKAAASRGLNPSVAMALAGSFWQRIMNRS